MTQTLKLTTTLACEIAQIDRDRFNEDVAAGHFKCAPETIPGRSRILDLYDTIALKFYSELLTSGATKQRAGRVACAVAKAARESPDEPVISYVEDYFLPPRGKAIPASTLGPRNKMSDEIYRSSNIRCVTDFNVAYTKTFIIHHVEEERSIVGSRD